MLSFTKYRKKYEMNLDIKVKNELNNMPFKNVRPVFFLFYALSWPSTVVNFVLLYLVHIAIEPNLLTWSYTKVKLDLGSWRTKI